MIEPLVVLVVGLGLALGSFALACRGFNWVTTPSLDGDPILRWSGVGAYAFASALLAIGAAATLATLVM